MFFDPMLLITYLAAVLLTTLIVCLLAFVVLRTAILGAMKAHTNWVDRGKP
ncbi:hypothetical protein [Microbacterium sp. Leaf151]|uniref:hypothetical protein n=1 Tax=Microbacterium sp. Leaf151 TaxID=1736276 RepID=UPI0012E3A2DE|nr:hypothetical protein [Microbacterium sp. Leaf151]